LRAQQGITSRQKPTKRDIPCSFAHQNGEPKQFFNKLLIDNWTKQMPDQNLFGALACGRI